jgi:acyl-CoA dehydrogenase
LQYAFAQIQQGLIGIFENMSLPLLGLVAAWWRLNPLGKMPSDLLGSQVARIIQTPGMQRDNLTEDIYLPDNPQEALGRLEQAMMLSVVAESILQKIKTAIKEGKLPPENPIILIRQALEAEIINLNEVELLTQAEAARNDAIQVDSFTSKEYQEETVQLTPEKAKLQTTID